MGVGAEYAITSNVSMRAEVERYEIKYYDVKNLDFVSASLIYNF